MEILEKIKIELEIFNKKKLDLLEQLRTEFAPMFKPLFEKSKIIDSVSWTQYTPYFNDGDSCEFGVYNDDLYINGEYSDDLDWFDYRIKYHLKGDKAYKNLLIENPNINIEECNIVEEFKDILGSVPEEFYEDLFGDHVQVTINRDGTISVSEYDHD